jgi:molybdopterin converting factor small subunit
VAAAISSCSHIFFQKLYHSLIVTLRFHTLLQKKTNIGNLTDLDVQVPDYATIEDVLSTLSLDLPWDSLILVVNHRVCDLEHVLSDNDIIDCIPALAGG